MLGKLLKYEIKSTGRLFLPAYGAVLALALLNRLFLLIRPAAHGFSLPQGVAMFGFVLIIMLTSIFTVLWMIQRFYKNLLSDEGYLMFTLPVKSSSLILSKVLVSAMWYIVTAVVTVGSIFIVAADRSFFAALSQFTKEAYSLMGANLPLYLLELFLLMVVGACSAILMIYASISIGHLFSKHRGLASVGAFLGITVAMDTLASLAAYFLSDFGPFNRWVEGIIYNPQPSVFHIAFWAAILLYLICGAIFFVITQQVLTKKLNLE